MSHFDLTHGAREELHQIHDYIAQFEYESALRLIRRIEERFELLADYPYLGVARPEFGATHRSFVVDGTDYIIIYRPVVDGVDILHIRHGSQDLRRLFDK